MFFSLSPSFCSSVSSLSCISFPFLFFPLQGFISPRSQTYFVARVLMCALIWFGKEASKTCKSISEKKRKSWAWESVREREEVRKWDWQRSPLSTNSLVSCRKHVTYFQTRKKNVLSHARLPQEKKKKGLSWPLAKIEVPSEQSLRIGLWNVAIKSYLFMGT